MTSQRYTAICLIAVLLSACASPQYARGKGPVAFYTSDKTAKQVAICVASAWESAGPGTTPVNLRPSETGYTLMLVGGRNTQVILDVDDVENGSTSSYYKGIAFGIAELGKGVLACQ